MFSHCCSARRERGRAIGGSHVAGTPPSRAKTRESTFCAPSQKTRPLLKLDVKNRRSPLLSRLLKIKFRSSKNMLFLNKERVLTPNTVDQTCNSSDHALSVALRVPTAVRRVRVTDECAMCINLQVDLATVASSLLHCTADVVEGVVRGCRHDCCSNVSAGILGTSSEHTARITSACKVAENSRQDGEHDFPRQ